MHKRIRTALSLLVCAMMLLTQFAFALDEGGANAGAEAADHAAAASEAVNEDTVPEEGITEVKNAEPVIEETGPAVKAAEPAGEEAEPVDNVKEASGEETRPAEKEGSTPAFSSETELDGVIVSVKAAEGVFPEGAKLSVEKVSDAEQKKVDKAVDAARDDDLNVAVAYSFDVKVLDRDGEVVQPADNNTVEVSFELDEADDVNLDATVYHLDDTEKGLRAEELRSETANDTVSAVTDGFSYYTVEFTYGGLQYVMDGNSSVALADILGKVGLEGEASDVSVSNDRLFSAEKKAGKWMVTAHRAFTSEEWMKVTIAGVVYEIVVTDAIPGDNVTSAVEMNAGETKEGDFTIGNGGVVLGPKNGTATIKNGTVTNNAKNDKKGQYGDTDGSAFIAQCANSLQFNDVTIKSGANTLVFNIWANCSITAEKTTLSGSNNSDNGVPFLMIGGYSNGDSGTLNFKGTSNINGAKGSIIGGNGGSVINVNDGTLTIKDSEIALKNGNRFVVKSGATLILDGTTLAAADSSDKPAITVEDGGKLILNNVTLEANNNITIQSGGEADFKGTITPKGKQQILVYGTLNLQETTADLSGNGAIRWIRIEGGGTANISKSTLSGSTSLGVIRANAGSALKIDKSIFKNNKAAGSAEQVNGGVILAWESEITIADSTFTGNSAAAAGGVIWQDDDTILSVDGESKFTDNIANSQGGAIFARNSSVTIGDGVTFEKNTAKFGGAVYLEKCTGTTIGKAVFEGNGTIFEGVDWPDIQTMDGGALYIREGSAVMNGTVFQENIAAYIQERPFTASGGAAYIYGANVKINGARFEYNLGQTYGGGLTVAHNSRAEIVDLEGSPTVFKGNLVENGMDFAGGGLFINCAYVRMMDAAIYNNAAEDAGGGLSTCTTGTAEVRVKDGAAIFDNEILAGKHPGGSGFYPPVDDVQNYKDIFFQTTDHKDADTGEIIPGRDDFPAYAYELYERMFNGGIHNWKAKPFTATNDEEKRVNAMVAQSNPGNKDVSRAKVVFTENQAWRHPELKTTVSGGAIGCNGLLEIGTSTEIKIIKLWNDKKNTAGVRPSTADFLKSLKILADGKEIDKEGLLISVITKDVDKYVLYNNVVNSDGKPIDFGNNEPWLIIVSGLPKYAGDKGELEIKYTVKEDEPSNYRLVKEEGDMETYFRLENKVQLVDIPVRKVWDEEDKYTGLRPKEITVSLLADGRKVRELKLNESNKWSGTFRDLVRYNGDKEIRYTVEEAGDENLSYYTCKITGDVSSGFTITNRLEVYTAGETRGIKTWKGDEDVIKKRPSEIVVNLLADGKVFKTVTASKANGWRIEFGHIPEYRDGKKISYTIEEVRVKGYKASYNGFNITNTYTGVKPDSSMVKGTDTGDDSPVAALIVLIAACTAGITGIALRRRKRNEE